MLARSSPLEQAGKLCALAVKPYAWKKRSGHALPRAGNLLQAGDAGWPAPIASHTDGKDGVRHARCARSNYPVRRLWCYRVSESSPLSPGISHTAHYFCTRSEPAPQSRPSLDPTFAVHSETLRGLKGIECLRCGPMRSGPSGRSTLPTTKLVEPGFIRGPKMDPARMDARYGAHPFGVRLESRMAQELPDERSGFAVKHIQPHQTV